MGFDSKDSVLSPLVVTAAGTSWGYGMDDRTWEILIDRIHDGKVVPVIGSRLLLSADGRTSLQGEVAKRLLEDCGIASDTPLPAFRELNEAVSMVLTQKGRDKTQELYESVHYAIRDVIRSHSVAGQSPVPEPIRQLAQITGFRLYVTLTPDDLLAQALKTRSVVNEIIHSPNQPTSDAKDLPCGWKPQPDEVQLMYMFGKSSSSPLFAIHDEDMLEYAHNVISHGKQVPRVFFEELQERDLLLVGCNFPDWLTRFFLRATNPPQKRLSEKVSRAWLVGPLPPEESDTPLTCFLQRYTLQTEILSQSSPQEFVAELYRRWMAQYGGAAQAVDPTMETAPPRGTAIFISYSRATDGNYAKLLYDSMLSQGLSESELWYDRRTIEPGQDYERKILDGIQRCKYFLPLVSRAADGRREAFVFREWGEATDRTRKMNGEFILPVIVDDECRPSVYSSRWVDAWRQDHIDFGHAPGGVPDDVLKKRLTDLVREVHKEKLNMN